MQQEPIFRVSYDAANLIKEFPPRWQHQNKQAVYEIACSSGYPFQGEIQCARWSAQQLPESLHQHSRLVVVPGIFDYTPSGTGSMEWHLNFADKYLFVAYGTTLLAQDELQVAEHPVLGSLREALISNGMEPETVDANGRPTPISITGVQRRCRIDTLPNPGGSWVHGLYGNAFARAPRSEVIAATQVITPPTISNILAMAAPAYGCGSYSEPEIHNIALTAYTGFLAARLESKDTFASDQRVELHTGFWGCGAFGGNRTLMTILQALAGDMAGVDVVFHGFDDLGVSIANQAIDTYHHMLQEKSSVLQLLEMIYQQRFRWGVSDGN